MKIKLTEKQYKETPDRNKSEINIGVWYIDKNRPNEIFIARNAFNRKGYVWECYELEII